jgi:ribosomal protein S18 acetylase RimI-like enzyme
MMNYSIELRKIIVSEYQYLRRTTGWDMLEDSVVKSALENDLFSVCIVHEKKTIGIGRVVGDGAIYFYIQDIIVHPDYQKQGVGKLIMDQVESYLEKAANSNSFIGLMAADGVKDFYKKYGYSERPDNRPGMFKIIKS